MGGKAGSGPRRAAGVRGWGEGAHCGGGGRWKASEASGATSIDCVAPVPAAWSDRVQGPGQCHLPAPVSVTSPPRWRCAHVDVIDQKLLLPGDGITEAKSLRGSGGRCSREVGGPWLADWRLCAFQLSEATVGRGREGQGGNSCFPLGNSPPGGLGSPGDGLFPGRACLLSESPSPLNSPLSALRGSSTPWFCSQSSNFPL